MRDAGTQGGSWLVCLDSSGADSVAGGAVGFGSGLDGCVIDNLGIGGGSADGGPVGSQ